MSAISQLPPFLRKMLTSPPRAGEGVHNWLFRIARHLHAHLNAFDMIDLLESCVRGCGRPVSRKEIQDAVQDSIACAWRPNGNAGPAPSAAPTWPSVNQEKRSAITRGYGGLADLWEESKPRVEDSEGHTEMIIDQLFPGNPLLCCGKSNSVFNTKPRNEWRGKLSMLALIVPSPMSAITGMTQDGKQSEHALSNTGARRFLVCEFDSGTEDEQAALLRHLGESVPLVCVAHSGGKSLHGWFFVADVPEDEVRCFFNYAVSLGADRRLWTRSQFTRMPDGLRDNGRRQTVFFCNFTALEVAR